MHENETEKLPKIQADEGDLNYLMTFPNLAGRKGVFKRTQAHQQRFIMQASQIEETDYNFSVGGVTLDKKHL